MKSALAPPGTEAAEGPSSSSSSAAATHQTPPPVQPQPQQQLSRYESQKRRDWNTFQQHLKNLKPPVSLARCAGTHVIEFMKYLDQFGKTKVHAVGCAHFGLPSPPAPCVCPLKQAWGSLDALVGRLRAAYEESGGRPESNPFGTKAVRIYLKEVRESQAKARGIPYEKKRKRRPLVTTASAGRASMSPATVAGSSTEGSLAAGSSTPNHGTATLGRTTDGCSTAAAAGADSSPAIADGSDASPIVR